VKDSGDILKEILNIPDDIPQDLLDKAEAWSFCPQSRRARSESVAASAAVLDDLPQRTALPASGDRLPCMRLKALTSASSWGRGHRFHPAGDESQRSALAAGAVKSSLVRMPLLPPVPRTLRRSRHRRRHER
jgi:hypothetical protein